MNQLIHFDYIDNFLQLQTRQGVFCFSIKSEFKTFDNWIPFLPGNITRPKKQKEQRKKKHFQLYSIAIVVQPQHTIKCQQSHDITIDRGLDRCSSSYSVQQLLYSLTHFYLFASSRLIVAGCLMLLQHLYVQFCCLQLESELAVHRVWVSVVLWFQFNGWFSCDVSE